MSKRVCIILLVFAFHGCLAPEPNSSRNTDPCTVSISGEITISGQRSSIPTLVADLKAHGYTPENPVNFAIPEKLPTDRLIEITRVLKTAGYKKLLFKKPKKTVSYTDK